MERANGQHDQTKFYANLKTEVLAQRAETSNTINMHLQKAPKAVKSLRAKEQYQKGFSNLTLEELETFWEGSRAQA